MSLNLGSLFELGEGLARQAITTAGTVVQVQTITEGTDPVSLERTETRTVHDTQPGIVVPVTGPVTQPVPGVEVRHGDWKVVLLPEVTPPVPGMDVHVMESRDPHLPGRDARVLGHVLSSAGAVLTVFARPR